MYLSIIIPAYNEENRLPKTLEEIDKYLSKRSYDYEIIVASGGSTDKTNEVVEGLKPKIKNLKLIAEKESNGKGYTTRHGLLEAQGEVRIFTDADNSTSIDQIENMLPWFSTQGGSAPGGKEGYDVVIGSRDIKGAVLDPPQPWLRQVLLGEGFKLYRKIILGLWGIEDTQCGFKGFTKKAVENIFPKCKINGFSFDPEILIIAQKLGYKIKEIPINWKNDLNSKVGFKSMVKMAIDMVKIRLNVIKGIYG